MRELNRVFQLAPEPPVHENLNDYIIKAVRSRELRWFSFFLHCYENRLNGRVRRFLLREGLDRYDPERFLDYKMGCVLAMLDCLREYNPTQGADFLTYVNTPPETVPLDRTNGALGPLKWCIATAAMVH